ncbi:MAG: NADAR family protein [Planctomycetia bacterium]|nr:NADAR family protein [Planctomycetia bacterium]
MSNAILEFKGEYHFLDNFYPAPVTWEGITYPTSEHAFQAAKTFDNDFRLQLAQVESPFRAKKMGRAVNLRTDWEERKYDLMEEIVLAKFHQNPDLAEKLIATGDTHLEEGNHHNDTTWGTVDGVGKNWLGKILMSVREKIK